ncbi:hypothetical protein [Streptomyces sp. BBFR102]|uniref:hypothetical protein n=1 Tax=Streptomyces sp. BBFR102 TaxID=3448171 RepID=UPI003F530441
MLVVVGGGRGGQVVVELRGGLDGDDAAVGADGVGSQETEDATVGSAIDEGGPGAEPVAREGARVRLPLAEQVLVALDDVAGGEADLVAGQQPDGGGGRVGAQVLGEKAADEPGLPCGSGRVADVRPQRVGECGGGHGGLLRVG